MKTLEKITLSATLILAGLSFAACASVADTDDFEDVEDDPIEEEQEDNQDQEDEDDLPLAQFDNDSLQAPAESHFLSPTRKGFSYTNDISSEVGDAADFIEFELPNGSNSIQRLHSIELECDFVGDLNAIAHVRIFEDGEPTLSVVRCNEGPDNTINIDNTRVQTAVVEFSSTAAATYMSYTLTVDGFR